MQQKKKGEISRVLPDPNKEMGSMVVKTLSEQYNEAFAKPRTDNMRIIDLIRWRKDQLNMDNDKNFLNAFFMEIGKMMVEEGKNTFLVENDHFITIWETIEE